ncbi:growth hormone-inducible transmembrane protein-like [Pectinophora gossypiella]|uniref:growth hormone-inducible transmembrane protein-like n=1 Tax=Pectinophora gossypiella TaxID=13191 RepID=UPI00214EB3C5|nr:growth hormone-inducible transmembrane protein-like [Pectinophora gossypiella]XP_049867735.1 growth hormone-inducible transmembrane protein-like [Pectinophora gossypiella]
MLSRMCISRFGTSHLAINVTQSLKTPVPQRFVPKNYVVRNYAREPRARVATRVQPTIWERLMAPAGPNAFSLGKGALAGASAVGLAALCYYGSGIKPGTLQEAHLWPQYVKDRIKTTYGYIAASLAVTAGSAVTVFRTPALLNLVARSGWMSILVTMGLMIGSGMVVRGMEYRPGFGPKQLAWLVHTGIMGAVIAPLCFLGGPILTRAAWYTAGVVGGLSTVAICAPSGEFLNMRAPLAMGLGAVFAASLASMFLPTTTALGAGLYSFSLYGGLVVFGGFLLYDTQMIVKRAETHPMYGFQPYDPINSAVSVYLDVLNIFMRIAMILAGGGGQRRK